MSQERVPPAGGLARLVAGRAQEHGQRSFLEDAQGGRVLTYARLAELVRQRAGRAGRGQPSRTARGS